MVTVPCIVLDYPTPRRQPLGARLSIIVNNNIFKSRNALLRSYATITLPEITLSVGKTPCTLGGDVSFVGR